MLDGAPCPDARARRAHHEGPARLDLGDHFWAGTALMLDGAARHLDARPWGGGVRRAGARPCVSARGVPRITIPKELTEECLRGGSAPPNGSRLSCGASAGWRKRPALRYRLAGAQTSASSESRPRQLQALVRPPLSCVRTRRLQLCRTRP